MLPWLFGVWRPPTATALSGVDLSAPGDLVHAVAGLLDITSPQIQTKLYSVTHLPFQVSHAGGRSLAGGIAFTGPYNKLRKSPEYHRWRHRECACRTPARIVVAQQKPRPAQVLSLARLADSITERTPGNLWPWVSRRNVFAGVDGAFKCTAETGGVASNTTSTPLSISFCKRPADKTRSGVTFTVGCSFCRLLRLSAVGPQRIRHRVRLTFLSARSAWLAAPTRARRSRSATLSGLSFSAPKSRPPGNTAVPPAPATMAEVLRKLRRKFENSCLHS